MSKDKAIAKPKYGYIFDGSYYQNGVYHAKSKVSEYTTCVGFCINVISGYLYDDPHYFEINDWENIPLNYEGFIDFYKQARKDNPNLDESDYQTHHRRIFPIEYLAAAYLNSDNIPVRKKKIDQIAPNLKLTLNKRISFSRANE